MRQSNHLGKIKLCLSELRWEISTVVNGGFSTDISRLAAAAVEQNDDESGAS